MAKTRDAQAKLKGDERLALDVEISELYRAGMSQTEIAKRIGKSQSAVSRALDRLRERWLQSALVNMHEAKMQHLARLEWVIEEAKEAWYASKEPARATSKRKTAAPGMPAIATISESEKESDPNPRYLEIVVKAAMDTAKVYGYMRDLQQVDANVNINVGVNADVLAQVDQQARAELDAWETERFSLPSGSPTVH